MSLNLFLNQFFEDQLESFGLKGLDFVFLRSDGVILYKNLKKIKEKDARHLGVLMGGAWQAAEAMNGLFETIKEKDEGRLSFNSSSSGIYVLPVKISQQEYFLGVVYDDILNPALLRNNMGKLVHLLEKSSQNMSSRETIAEKKIFENITDDEIDRAFQF